METLCCPVHHNADVGATGQVCPVTALGHPFVYTAGFTLNALGYSALLTLALFGPSGPRKREGYFDRWMARIGVCSYSIYLWHCPLVLFTLPWLHSRVRWLVFGVYLLTSIGLGAAMWRLVEVPTLSYRNRKWPTRIPISAEGDPGTICGAIREW